MSLEKFCSHNHFGTLCERMEGHDGPHQGVNIFNEVTQFMDGPVIINRASYAPTTQTLEDLAEVEATLDLLGHSEAIKSFNRIKLLLGVPE